MVIKTKYSLMNNVWAMHENKAVGYFVFSVEPIIRKTNDGSSETIIRYRVEDHGKYYQESELFESKEALIQSL
jgi:hypothetical protein